MAKTDGLLSKAEARRLAYAGLHDAKAARFPFPIEGRIPNFVGAEAAARRLAQLPVYQQARAIKVNPDSPQLPVRAMALRDGKIVFLPSPRLRGSFLRIFPDDVPQGQERKAASLKHAQSYGKEVDLTTLKRLADEGERIDLIVTGCTAVTRDGARAGKGEGYSDLEYAILRELGMPGMPVVTTVHPAQIVPDFETDRHDLSLDWIVTPEGVIDIASPAAKPTGIDWGLLDDQDLESMPVLAELRQLTWESLTLPDLIALDLKVLFVGINPGRKSAATGHHFAGPGNHFWRLLHEAGFTPVQYEPRQQRALLDHGLGIVNIVERPSRGESDLSWDELVEGGVALRERILAHRPRIVAFLGKNVYRAYAGLKKSAPLSWGLQPHPSVSGVQEFLAPNPSARSAIPYAERLKLFQELRRLAQGVD